MFGRYQAQVSAGMLSVLPGWGFFFFFFFNQCHEGSIQAMTASIHILSVSHLSDTLSFYAI